MGNVFQKGQILWDFISHCEIWHVWNFCMSFYRKRNEVFIPRHTESGGYYVIPSELWVSIVHPSVNASFPCSNFSTFWPIFFKRCIDIGIGEEWYRIASGLISFWNNKVMALDVCQKCFALRFCSLTLVPFYRFSSDFAQTLVSERSGMGLQVGYIHSEKTELWPLIYVQNAFLVNILGMNRQISIKFCICIA